MRIVFLGTPEFAVPVLEMLAHGASMPVAVISQPDRPRDRGRQTTPTPVKLCAEALGIPVLAPQRLRDEPALLAELKPDLMITAAYGQILTQEILDIPPLGVWNVHASLLPRYRGAAPVQWAVIHGEAQTGVTIMQTARGVDTGDIVSQAVLDIGPHETAGELMARLSQLGAELLAQTLCRLPAIEKTPQNHEQATHAPQLQKQDGCLDFSQTCREVYNRFRGVSPKPGAFFMVKGQSYRVLAAQPCEGRDAGVAQRASVEQGATEVQRASAEQDASVAQRANAEQGASMTQRASVEQNANEAQYVCAEQHARGVQIARETQHACGKILCADPAQGLEIACRDGALRVTQLQAPGKKAMDAKAFFLGNTLCGDRVDAKI